jgi:hypothetical protein
VIKQFTDLNPGDRLYDGAKCVGEFQAISGAAAVCCINGKNYRLPANLPIPWAPTKESRRFNPHQPECLTTEPVINV